MFQNKIAQNDTILETFTGLYFTILFMWLNEESFLCGANNKAGSENVLGVVSFAP